MISELPNEDVEDENTQRSPIVTAKKEPRDSDRSAFFTAKKEPREGMWNLLKIKKFCIRMPNLHFKKESSELWNICYDLSSLLLDTLISFWLGTFRLKRKKMYISKKNKI